jgi:DNA primase
MSDLTEILAPYLGDPTKDQFETTRGTQAEYRCPFHAGGQEGTPSFFLNLDNGFSYCHTCDDWWSLANLMKRIRVPMPVADAVLKSLGLDTPAKSLWLKRLQPDRDIILPEALIDIFMGGGCPTLLQEAGFTQDTLRYFEIGYDTRHNRITYPVRNVSGELIGISGGKALPHQRPKYLHYTHEQLNVFIPGVSRKCRLHVGQHLWNLNRVWARCFLGGSQEPIIVVEGFKALMWVWQCGFRNVVCSFGASLSNVQRRLLSYFGNLLIIFFDFDENYVGQQATVKALRQFREENRIARAFPYPERVLVSGAKTQPDDLITDEIASGYHRSITCPLLTTAGLVPVPPA